MARKIQQINRNTSVHLVLEYLLTGDLPWQAEIWSCPHTSKPYGLSHCTGWARSSANAQKGEPLHCTWGELPLSDVTMTRSCFVLPENAIFSFRVEPMPGYCRAESSVDSPSASIWQEKAFACWIRTNYFSSPDRYTVLLRSGILDGKVVIAKFSPLPLLRW